MNGPPSPLGRGYLPWFLPVLCPWTRRGHQQRFFPPGDPGCPLGGETFTEGLLAPTRKLSLEAWPHQGIPPGCCGPPRCRCLSSEEAVCVQTWVLLPSERALPPSPSSPALSLCPWCSTGTVVLQGSCHSFSSSPEPRVPDLKHWRRGDPVLWTQVVPWLLRGSRNR